MSGQKSRPACPPAAAALALAAALWCPSPAAAAVAHPHLDLDGLFTYGLGNGSALGGQLHLTASFGVWRTTRALGTLEVGAQLGYIQEPSALQPWMTGSATTGTTHRVPFAVTAGHGFRFGRGDRASFGVHLYAGGVHWISSYDVRYPSRGIDSHSDLRRTVLDVGAFLRFTYRPHPVIGLSLQLGAPFYGVGPDTVVGLFTTGIGLTARLR